MHVEAVPCRSDNYAYIVRGGAPQNGAPPPGVVVDPSEAGPILAALQRQPTRLCGVLITHHHWDHTDGIEELRARAEDDIWVAAHASDRGRVPSQDHFVAAPCDAFVTTGLKLANIEIEAMHVPGHTLGAIAWKIGEDIFTGDTLFAGGCGRLNEGRADQLFASLKALVQGPESRRLWFGHEYTAANLRFACAEALDDLPYRQRLAKLGLCTAPTTVGDERRTNIFIHAQDVAAFARLRAAKDVFAG